MALTKARLKLFSILTLTILLLIVIVQNTDVVETRLLFVTVAMPRAALLGLSVLVGFLLGVLTSVVLGRPSKRS